MTASAGAPAEPGYIRTRLQRAGRQLRYVPVALRLAWSASPRATALWAVVLLVLGLLPALVVLFTRAIVDALVAYTTAGLDSATAAQVLGLAVLIAGLMWLTEALSSAMRFLRTRMAEDITDHVTGLVQDQSLTVDLAFYEQPDFFDHLHRARQEATYRPVNLLENVGQLAQGAVTLVALVAVLLPYGVWLPVALLASTLPALVVVLRMTERYHSWTRRTTSDQRLAWYLDQLTANRESAAEVRLFGLGPHLQSSYREVRQRLRGERLALAASEGRADVAAASLGLVVAGGAFAAMVAGTLAGPLSLGDLALMVQAFRQGQEVVRALLGHVGQIYRNSLFIGDLLTFLELDGRLRDPEEPAVLPPPPLGIRFHDVTFAYPGGRSPALVGFDLAIAPGQMAAIVGRNGAGKSTLVKLLCRFYDPVLGSVEVGGLDLRDLSQTELRRSIAVLFQDPVRYNDTAFRNIALADLAAPPFAVPEAARAAGAESLILDLPEGYDTQLGVWFPGGTDLSVGEWQRLALARAYLRRAPILVLDEPTSAMDPWSEAEWFRRFRVLAAGATVLLITHRLTTARMADVIHVMEQGRVVESGTHGDLLAAGGAYARSWTDQMHGLAEAGPLAEG